MAPRPAAAASPARVPQGFVGAVLGDPVFPGMTATSAFDDQMNQMVASGVEGVRAVFDWSMAQPYAKASDVPADQQANFSADGVDSVPTDWAPLDALVAAAAKRHLPVLPVIVGAPLWDGQLDKGAVLAIPRHDGAYANFCKALVKRYGVHGTFWRTHGPVAPITAWQIWNEPNVPAFWMPQPFVNRYVGLLRAARTAIKSVNPHAKIVLAGLANYSWQALRQIYQIRGARNLFDIVGLHPYTKTPQGVITILTLGRQIMRRYGDESKPMLADEISWPSSLGQTPHTLGFDFAVTEAGQARNVAAALPLLAADRTKLGLLGIYYYTWASTEHRNGLAFDFAGLLKLVGDRLVRKPAFYAFRHAALGLERCRTKGSVATVCRRRA